MPKNARLFRFSVSIPNVIKAYLRKSSVKKAFGVKWWLQIVRRWSSLEEPFSYSPQASAHFFLSPGSRGKEK